MNPEFISLRRPAPRKHLPTAGGIRGAAAAILMACAVAALPARAQDARYVAASGLNVRAAPNASAAIVGRWRINQPVQVLADKGGWCEVSASEANMRGFVDCNFLARAPVTLAQVQADAAEAALAVWRLGHIDSWTSAFERNPAETRRQLDALITQFERHFALSPSLYTYRELDALLIQVANARPDDAALAPWLEARQAQLAPMRRAFNTDFSKEAREALQQGAMGGLAALVDRRHNKAMAQLGERPAGPALAPSFFSAGRWALGWAGGPLAVAGPARGDGVPYRLHFDASGVWSLAPLFEMAKAQRAVVRASWGQLKGGAIGLSQARRGALGVVETLRLETRLSAWAVTPQGLRPAQLLGAQYEGGACSGEDSSTRADLVVPGAPPERVLAVFATSAPLDPSRAQVRVERRRFLSPLWDLFENTLTSRETMSVDLDGDGVPDLRVVISQDAAVGQSEDGLRHAGYQRMGNQRTVGWYANNVFSLEANIDGQWRMLSIFAVSTCT